MGFIQGILFLVLGVLGLALFVFIAIKLVQFFIVASGHLGRFIGGMIGDTFRGIGSIITGCVYALLSVGSLVFGRWSAATHFAQALKGEVKNAGLAAYRVCIGHPARLFGMRGLVEGVEQRLPAMIDATPGTDAPSKRAGGLFEGYKIVGSLPAGGSGGKLYIAEPDDIKRAGFDRVGQLGVGQVVIKSFSLSDGSTLPQIVRESRSLDAAKKLGLILDHDLTPQRFFYVMRYVPGQNLTLVTKQLHAMSGEGGLDAERMRRGLGYVSDLLSQLERYHRGGLWHKDVKPDNIIVDRDAAHLVDFGLVTPLRSSMTLTTHGTEYFRDPELVRQALKGVKVHEVDGSKFDIYGVGAVLYALIEDSFPAHGVLSPITKRCPEALRWVVRRAMTDYDKRYPTAGAMLADIDALRRMPDVLAARPVDLPSMREGGNEAPLPAAALREEAMAAAGTPIAGSVGSSAPVGEAGAGSPGRFERMWNKGPVFAHVEFGHGTPKPPPIPAGAPGGGERVAAGMGPTEAARSPRRTAKEQLGRARERAHAARERARTRMGVRRPVSRPYSNGVKLPVVGAIVTTVGIAGAVALVTRMVNQPRGAMPTAVMIASNDESPVLTLASGAGGVQRLEAAREGHRGVESLPPPSFSGKPVLVFGDLAPGVSQEFADEIAGAIESLRDAGASILSNLTAGGAALAPADMLSDLSYTMAGVPIDASDAPSKLGTWITARGGHPTAIVWVSSAPEGDGLSFRVFADKTTNSMDDAIASQRVLSDWLEK